MVSMLQKPVAVLDIGNGKIVCLIARIETNGTIRVLGIGHQISQGIKAGMVMDMRLAEGAILGAISAAEKMAGVTLGAVSINISGSSLRSRRLTLETDFGTRREVTDEDLRLLTRRSQETELGPDEYLLHVIPMHYSLDQARGIQQPLGMLAQKLGANFHLIAVSKAVVDNLRHTLTRCRMRIERCVASPLASALACLTPDEMQLGSVIIDLGAGNTCVAVYEDGRNCFVGSVAIGGMHITHDVARGLSTSISYAERIKTLYGSTSSAPQEGRDMLDIPLTENEDGTRSDEVQHISRAQLVSIIRPRVEEVFEHATKLLSKSGLNHLSARIVLTGGGSQISGIRELANQVFHKHVRIARPTPLDGLAESTKGPGFSTAVGMLHFLAQEDQEKQQNVPESNRFFENVKIFENSGGSMQKAVKWFLKNF